MIIDIPTVEGGVFIDGGANTLGTIVRASFLNSLMKSSTATTKEIQTILTKNSIQPDDRVHDQLFKAISKMVTDKVIIVTSTLGDSKELAASQYLANENNKVAKNAQTTANNAEKVASSKIDIVPRSLSSELLSNQLLGGNGFRIKPTTPLPPDSPAKGAFKLMQIGDDAWPTQIVFEAYSNQAFLRTRSESGGAFNGWTAMIQEVEADQIFYFDSAIPPFGFIARNGQAIDKSKMPKLYAKYGANMPDDRNRVHRMQGSLTGAVGTTQEDSIKDHAHNIKGTSSASGSGGFLSSGGSVSFRGDMTEMVGGNVETTVKSRIIIACNKIQ